MRHGGRAGGEAVSAPLIPLCIEDLTWFCVEMSSKVNFLNIRRCLFTLYTQTQLYKDNIIASAWSCGIAFSILYLVTDADSRRMADWASNKEGEVRMLARGSGMPPLCKTYILTTSLDAM